jgi:YHS domain-containing protein
LEQPLPHAESLPAKPPVSGESILPFQSIAPGPGATPGSTKPEGGTPPGPSGKPAGQNPASPAAQGLPGFPDFGPGGLPDATPKANGSGIEPLTPLSPPKESSPLPGSGGLELPVPTPGTPAAQPPKALDKNGPAPISPDSAPSPAVNPLEPAPAKPIKGISLSRRTSDAVAERATDVPHDSQMQANWNSSLEPEVLGDNQLRTASFEQRTAEVANPFRCGMGGYCPVQLQENDRWMAGSPDFQITYQGQVFHFSSEAARKRFEAAPEKYAPVQSGNDVVLAAEENRTVPGNVNHSAVWHGRLYLFSNSATLAAFQADPARYAKRVRQVASDSAAP